MVSDSFCQWIQKLSEFITPPEEMKPECTCALYKHNEFVNECLVRASFFAALAVIMRL